MKKSIWISYDLGIKGDYPSLYSWLDKKKAVECGNSIAFLLYECEKDLIAELKNELEKELEFSNGDRIYVIYKQDDKIKGHFIRGGRKMSPWTGYAPTFENLFDE